MVSKFFTSVFCCVLTVSGMTGLFSPLQASPLKDLNPLLWENRLIVIFADNAQTDAFKARLQAVNAELSDRHIVWFIDDGKRLSTNYPGQVSKHLSSALASRWSNTVSSNPQVFLIGKDGGTKLRLMELDLDAIFSTIDAMPMRRAEMRRAAGTQGNNER